MNTRPVIEETMRIGGRKVDADGVVPVHYPYTNEVIGTVPAGRAEHAAQAFAIAAAYKPKLTRYERQQILFRAAELIRGRKGQLSDLITLELGLSKKDSLYEVGRAYDVFTLAGMLAILDDGQIFSCDLTPTGQTPQDIHQARAGGRNFGDNALQSPAQYGLAQGGSRHCQQQLRGGEAHRIDSADRHSAGRYPL